MSVHVARVSRATAEWLLLAACLLLLGAYLGYESLDSRRTLLATEEVRLTTLSRVVTQQVARHLEGGDRALLGVRDQLPALLRQKDGTDKLTRMVDTLAGAMPGMRVMMVIDAQGRVTASTLPEMVGRNFGGRDYFRAAKARPDTDVLFVSAPFANSLGSWTTLLVRVIPGPGGEFGGIVFASMEAKEIGDMLESIRYAPDMWAAVGHVGGKLFVVRPEVPDLAALDTRRDAGSLLNRHLASGREFTLQAGTATAFGIEVLMAQRDIRPAGIKMDGYLILAVARGLPQLYAPWRRDTAYRAAFLVLMATVSSVLLFLTQRRRRLSTQQAAEDERQFREIFDSVSDAIFIHDAATGAIVDVNRRMLEMYGMTREQALAAGVDDLSAGVPPYSMAEGMEKIRRVMAEGPQIFEWRARGTGGRQFWVEVSLRLARIGRQERVLAAVRDITERKRFESELRVAAAAFESSEGIVVTDADGIVLRINEAFTRICGYRADEIVGKTLRLLKSGRHDAAFYQAMWDTILATGSWQGEIWDRHKDGHIYPKWLTISAVQDDAGVVTHYVGAQYDITERKVAEERINALAFYDQLTGLPNRTLLRDRLNRAIAAGARSGSHGALLFIDLDNFKTLNDTQGHEVGDLLLKEVATRLRQCIRDEDTAARQGGDEFVVVLSGLGAVEQDAAQATEIVAEKILTALARNYQLGSVAHRCSASIGVTLFQGGTTPLDDLMKQADLAMYKAKATGRNLVRFFDPAMEAVVQARANLDSDLRQAVDERQFLLHYQPQVTNGRVTGAEVLVRWRHPRRGMVSPADFIPLAEDTGLIVPLGRWVLETACGRLAEWSAVPALAPLTVAVNVSARQFHQRDFVDQVLAVVRQTGANPHRLKIELTESLLVADVEQIIDKMYALKTWGIGFSLDDFGTGYSSLSYLRSLPLDQLKIDQSFVRDVLTDPNDAAIARTVVALGQSLGLAVIAEGVETEAQRDFLIESGCHAYQGYLFSKPVPVEDFERLVVAAAGGGG